MVTKRGVFQLTRQLKRKNTSLSVQIVRVGAVCSRADCRRGKVLGNFSSLLGATA